MKYLYINKLGVMLSLFFLISCNDPQTQTIVTLHTKEAKDLKKVIRESLGDEIKFSAAGDQVVIFAKKKNIKPTLKLLKVLDQWPSAFLLTLRAEKKHQYSTIKSPLPFTLQSERNTLIQVNNTELVFRLRQVSENQSLLIIKSLKTGKAIEQNVLLTDGVWLKTNLLDLGNYPWIKIEIQKEK